jgi:hypothetical protein
MIDPRAFAQKQLELAAEFGKFIIVHPGIDDRLPDGAFVYFEIDGQPEFNEHGRDLADRKRREGNVPVVRVRLNGLIDPVIEPITGPV